MDLTHRRAGRPSKGAGSHLLTDDERLVLRWMLRLINRSHAQAAWLVGVAKPTFTRWLNGSRAAPSLAHAMEACLLAAYDDITAPDRKLVDIISPRRQIDW